MLIGTGSHIDVTYGADNDKDGDGLLGLLL